MGMRDVVVMSIRAEGDQVESSDHPVIKDVAGHSGNLDDDTFSSCAFWVAK
jgi:hypothetical protein